MCVVESKLIEKVIVDNCKVWYNYIFFDIVEVGIVLFGIEVKVIREGCVNLCDSYGCVEEGEVFFYNIYISFYSY